MIKPFKVDISNKILSNIYLKVKNYPWQNMPKDKKWLYGTNLGFMKKISDHWLHKYNWKKTEKKINKFKNFKKKIENLDIHFIYAVSYTHLTLPTT